MSYQVINRIVELATKGYIVQISSDFMPNSINIRMSMNDHHAMRVLSVEEIEQSNFDVMLYAINRLVDVLDGALYGV